MAGRYVKAGYSPISPNKVLSYDLRSAFRMDVPARSGIRLLKVQVVSLLVLTILIVALFLLPALDYSVQAAQTPPTFELLNIVKDTQEGKIFLPVVMKRWPPIPDIPVLNSISNPDGDGYYLVVWNDAYLAEIYVLQEADNASFSNPTERYRGTATSWNATGKSPGTYYYRVMASNSWGNSGWSNTQQVTVSPPTADVSVENNTGGTLCYEVDGTGIGRKCFGSGISFYGSFPSGTYTWHASAPCGTASGTEYYEPGEFVHEFWCE